jgi:hypothetical protein
MIFSKNRYKNTIILTPKSRECGLQSCGLGPVLSHESAILNLRVVPKKCNKFLPWLILFDLSGFKDGTFCMKLVT